MIVYLHFKVSRHCLCYGVHTQFLIVYQHRFYYFTYIYHHNWLEIKQPVCDWNSEVSIPECSKLQLLFWSKSHYMEGSFLFFPLFRSFKHFNNRLKVSLLARCGTFTHDYQTIVWDKNVWIWVWLFSLKSALQQKVWKTIGERRIRESWTLEVVSFLQEKPRKAIKTDDWKSREFTVRCNP